MVTIVHGTSAWTPAVRAAGLLNDELASRGVKGDVHGGYGLALVSVHGDLVVWTDGTVYRWWAGHLSRRTGRRLYAVYGVDNPATVARGVMLRYVELDGGQDGEYGGGYGGERGGDHSGEHGDGQAGRPGERRPSFAPPPDRTVPPPGRALRGPVTGDRPEEPPSPALSRPPAVSGVMLAAGVAPGVTDGSRPRPVPVR
ncbi:hypothetical protein ABT340_05090 [Streptosporangium sp. NPDC000239]|uniref:hypothetical protein n=1 Tax=Streptosporangium sp. NPDC000239 TaxID=3154248 RepID=UPI00332BBE8D